MKNNHQYLQSALRGIFVGFVGVFIFSAGFFLRGALDTQGGVLVAQGNSEHEFGLLVEVQQLLDQIYLRPQPDATTRQYAAIRGLLSSLNDPNTFFIEPFVAQSEAHTLAGTYGGIGVLVQRNERAEFVLYPYPDGPAVEAGIEDGDILLAIDGEIVEVTSHQDAIDQRMRGQVEDGAGVELTVLKATGEEYTVFIVFDVINVPSVFWRLLTEDERIGYIQILRFTNRTPQELASAIAELQESSLEAFILDLRNNTGGLLQESIQVAGIFLDDGVIAIEESQRDERIFTHDYESLLTDKPLVVLVNQRTASASELVAGALRDRDRATLIGQTTFGKGTVQQIFSLSDGSSVHITSAQWLTPNRSPIDGAGLEPDIAMIPADDGRDVELGEAIRYIQVTLLSD